MLDDVLVVLQRAETASRMVDEIERDCVELGTEGRLIRAQLEELAGELPDEKRAVVSDYHSGDEPAQAAAAMQKLSSFPAASLLEIELIAELLGYPRGVNPIDTAVSPRGYRALGHMTRLPRPVVEAVVGAFAGLEGIVGASLRDLEAVEGVGSVRAREIREGLRRLQEHNLAERFLRL